MLKISFNPWLLLLFLLSGSKKAETPALPEEAPKEPSPAPPPVPQATIPDLQPTPVVTKAFPAEPPMPASQPTRIEEEEIEEGRDVAKEVREDLEASQKAEAAKKKKPSAKKPPKAKSSQAPLSDLEIAAEEEKKKLQREIEETRKAIEENNRLLNQHDALLKEIQRASSSEEIAEIKKDRFFLSDTEIKNISQEIKEMEKSIAQKESEIKKISEMIAASHPVLSEEEQAKRAGISTKGGISAEEAEKILTTPLTK